MPCILSCWAWRNSLCRKLKTYSYMLGQRKLKWWSQEFGGTDSKPEGISSETLSNWVSDWGIRYEVQLANGPRGRRRLKRTSAACSSSHFWRWLGFATTAIITIECMWLKFPQYTQAMCAKFSDFKKKKKKSALLNLTPQESSVLCVKSRKRQIPAVTLCL